MDRKLSSQTFGRWHVIGYAGKINGERKTASQVAREAGVKPATVHQWLRRGMSKEDILNRLHAI